METEQQVVDIKRAPVAAGGGAKNLQGLIDAAVAEVGKILLGKEPQIRLALC